MNRFKCPACGGNQYTSADTAEGFIYCGNDEPFSQLKGEIANCRALAIIQEISHKLGLQIIMISDERVSREDIIANADKVFHVYQKSGVSNVKEVV